MSFVSAPFLLLFLPIALGAYYLLPGKNDLRLRNIFLVIASLVFYVWEEPVIIFLLLGMIFLTWLFGKMAFQKKNTLVGKTAVCLTVVINIAVMLALGKLEFFTSFPIGFSFFIFSSVSYVVDTYRGQCKAPGNILQTALYTSVFFRILQGPIVSYREFEGQISSRKQSMELIVNGIWRFSIGLCKKILIADNLLAVVNLILASELSEMTLGDAWLFCIAYLVYMYFDFSGYSDMAIGLAQMFGFSIPENFNYPYISASIGEFWRRWHITLCAWFTEYLYYPILLGPSMKLRKFLRRLNVRKKTAQNLQNIFVTGAVWLTTALWHGMNLRYAIWGLSNCAGMLLEPHIKPLKNKRLNRVLRCAGLLLFLCLSVPLIGVASFKETGLFYRAMFTGSLAISTIGKLCVKNYGLYLAIGIVGCFPILPYAKKQFFCLADKKYHKIWDICGAILLIILVIIAISYVFTGNTVDFLYQN